MSSVSDKCTSGCTCEICETKLICPQCTLFKNEKKQPNKYNTCCSHATLVAIAAVLLVSPILFGQPSIKMHLCIPPKVYYATGSGLKEANIEERATAILHIVAQEGEEYNKNMGTITCEVIHELSGEKCDCGVHKIKWNQYEISYRATTRGRHQLHIKVEDKHIIGSPFTVIVKLPVQEVDTPIKIISGVEIPWGVAVNQRGEIIVADGHCISIFSPTGEKLRSFGSYGSEIGQFNNPRGITVDDNDNILVADWGNNRIQIFSSDYKFIANIGSKGNKNSKFIRPLGVAISPTTKNIAIVSDYNNRVQIQIRNPDLTFNSSFGSEGIGSGSGQFYHPHSVAFDSAGNMYVSDTWNHRIQVFNPEGTYLRQFGEHGNGEGKLDSPIGIYIDGDDIVYVANELNNCVLVFTCEGTFLTSFGTHGKEPGQFSHPHGITVDKNGIIYVSDRSNNRLQMF